MEAYVQEGKLDQIPNQNYAALDILIEQGRDVMLLTSRNHSELKHMLEPDHLLAKRVTAFYYKDNTKFHKPDPRVFDELFEAHGLQPTECVYIGDSPSDAAAAKQAGLHFIASLESGIREKEEFNAFGTDGFVNAFSEIVEAVAAVEKQPQTAV
jgi:phosphoglycolate phosphatase